MERVSIAIIGAICLIVLGCSQHSDDDLIYTAHEPYIQSAHDDHSHNAAIHHPVERGMPVGRSPLVVQHYPSDRGSRSKVTDQHNGSQHWSYSGHSGPEHWGNLNAEYSQCADGLWQSPVDLNWSKPFEGGSLALHYDSSLIKIIDNGHTIQVNFTPGNYAVIRGVTYELLQVHFHAKSEHTIAGQSFPMEAHLVHKHEKGGLAVVGIMFIEGKENSAIANIWKHLPDQQGHEVTVPGVQINASTLLPDTSHYYHYIGSLTTPPCSEGVNWNVLNSPVEISRDQIQTFRSMYSHNNRPVQALHGRQPVLY